MAQRLTINAEGTKPPRSAGGSRPRSGASVPVAQSGSDVVEGIPLVAYGDSLTAAFGTPYPQRRWLDRLGTRLCSLSVTNRAVIGWKSQDGATYAFGTPTAAAGYGAAVAGTWANSAFPGGVVFLAFGRNDAGKDGDTSATHRAAYFNGLHALTRMVRASARTEDSASAFVYTGTWGTKNSVNLFMSGGAWTGTTTPGDKVTVTTPVGTDFDLALVGFAATVAAAPFSITVDGNSYTPPYGPTTGAGQAANNINVWQSQGGIAAGVALGYGPLVIPFHGLSNQAHTIVVTHTGTSGQTLGVDCLLQQSPTPPTVVLIKTAQIGAAGYASYPAGASWAVDQAYNALIDTLIANMAVADGSVVSWDPNANGWTPALVSSQDPQHIHMADPGAAVYADGIMTLLNSLPARLGLMVV